MSVRQASQGKEGSGVPFFPRRAMVMVPFSPLLYAPAMAPSSAWYEHMWCAWVMSRAGRLRKRLWCPDIFPATFMSAPTRTSMSERCAHSMARLMLLRCLFDIFIYVKQLPESQPSGPSGRSSSSLYASARGFPYRERYT